MRPDQHKKKRSNQYKKKHESQLKEGGKKQDYSKNNKQSSPSTAVTDLSNQENIPETSTAERVQDVDEFQSTFTKREVTSNWERYELENEQEKVIGEDFDILINAAGGTSSYFRPASGIDLESEDVSSSPMLSIDVVQLCKTLESIPFLEKYRIDELSVDKALLQSIINGNEEVDHVQSKHGNPFAQALGFNFMNTKDVNNKSSEDVVDTFTVNTNNSLIIVDGNSEDVITSQIGNIDEESFKESSMNENNGQVHATMFDEPGLSEQPEPKLTDDLDIELDELLNNQAKKGEIEYKTKTTPISSIVPFTESQEEEEDLEEWLDSIL